MHEKESKFDFTCLTDEYSDEVRRQGEDCPRALYLMRTNLLISRL